MMRDGPVNAEDWLTPTQNVLRAKSFAPALGLAIPDGIQLKRYLPIDDKEVFFLNRFGYQWKDEDGLITFVGAHVIDTKSPWYPSIELTRFIELRDENVAVTLNLLFDGKNEIPGMCFKITAYSNIDDKLKGGSFFVVDPMGYILHAYEVIPGEDNREYFYTNINGGVKEMGAWPKLSISRQILQQIHSPSMAILTAWLRYGDFLFLTNAQQVTNGLEQFFTQADSH